MGTEVLERRFAAIGARLSVRAPALRASTSVGRVASSSSPLPHGGLVELEADRDDRHLLLLVVTARRRASSCAATTSGTGSSRHPEDARGVTGVAAAKAALQPELVRTSRCAGRPFDANAPTSARASGSSSRRSPTEPRCASDEPLSRGAAGHLSSSRSTRRTLVNAASERISTPARTPAASSELHVARIARPELSARAAARITTSCCTAGTGLMNTEQGARAMRHVAFLD